jgi:hypothetical protein
MLVLASYLMHPDQPRGVAGRVVGWEGRSWTATPGAAGWLSSDSPELSAEGKGGLAGFRAHAGG